MDHPCNLTVQRTEDGYLVRLEGHGTREQSPSLQDFVQHAIEQNQHVFVDLSACEYLDSTFLGCLAILSRDANMEARRFAVVASEPVRRKVFGCSQLEKIVPTDEQRPDVVSDAVALPTTKLELREFGRHVMETHEELAKLGGPAAAAFQAIASQLREELK